MGAEKYDFRAPKEQRPTVFRSAEKKKKPKKVLEGRKSVFAAKHHNNEAAPKKKTNPILFRLGAEKYDFRASKEKRRPII